MWVRIVTEIIYNDDSVVLVDPDLFVAGSREEIESFVFLITLIPFAHCFHHRYNITTTEAAQYACDFIVPIEKKVHSLSLKETNLDSTNCKYIFSKLMAANLVKLDLSSNNLDDEVFEALHKSIKAGAKRLSYINISKNKIKMGK